MSFLRSRLFGFFVVVVADLLLDWFLSGPVILWVLDEGLTTPTGPAVVSFLVKMGLLAYLAWWAFDLRRKEQKVGEALEGALQEVTSARRLGEATRTYLDLLERVKEETDATMKIVQLRATQAQLLGEIEREERNRKKEGQDNASD